MKVRSFTVGLAGAEGITSSFECLDERVAKLGNITIHSCTDTYYTEEQSCFNGPTVVRVVVYDD